MSIPAIALVSVIPGKMCVIVVVHAVRVDGVGLHAKWEDRAEGGKLADGALMSPVAFRFAK
jgi:hypothetical protein